MSYKQRLIIDALKLGSRHEADRLYLLSLEDLQTYILRLLEKKIVKA